MKSYQEAIFGTFQGQNIVSYTFENDLGYRLKVMTYGATVLEYVTSDKQGQFANIVLGFDHFDAYVGNSPKYGASIGPVAGRIAKAQFELNGETYQLEVNNAENCIIVALRVGTVPFFKLRKSQMKASLSIPNVQMERVVFREI